MTRDHAEKPDAKADRLTREATALRANLLKRKNQARLRRKADNEADRPADRHPTQEGNENGAL